MRLEGKVAVITGAAVGIQGELMNFGGSAGWRFVEEGARVVVSDRPVAGLSAPEAPTETTSVGSRKRRRLMTLRSVPWCPCP